jgi:hypothetical protein
MELHKQIAVQIIQAKAKKNLGVRELCRLANIKPDQYYSIIRGETKHYTIGLLTSLIEVLEIEYLSFKIKNSN